MNGKLRALCIGAAKTAISNLCGFIVAFPAVDPEHFSLATFGGWKRVVGAALWITIIGEARFFKQWADGVNGGSKKS